VEGTRAAAANATAARRGSGGAGAAAAEEASATRSPRSPVPSRSELARAIDHTCLRADATPADAERLCGEALRHGFAAVCVNPVYLPVVVPLLAGSRVAACTVVDFPLGAGSARDKAAQAEAALEAGARELDVVQPVGLVKAGRFRDVREHLQAVIGPARQAGATVKVILEAALLTGDELERSCRIAVEAGAQFVKTSTGFGPGGATVELVRRLRDLVGPGVGVKAAGGIRDWATACAMLVAGADRIGTSAAVAIVRSAPDGGADGCAPTT
jgi:deoxyribose-phosphate aldolase